MGVYAGGGQRCRKLRLYMRPSEHGFQLLGARWGVVDTEHGFTLNPSLLPIQGEDWSQIGHVFHLAYERPSDTVSFIDC